MPYWRVHYHGIWACKNREPLITPELEPQLYQYLRGKGLELGAIIHEVGGIEDHTHLSFSLPPKYSVANFIGQLKGASSHWVSKVLRHPQEFDWQRGYGVLSHGGKDLARERMCAIKRSIIASRPRTQQWSIGARRTMAWRRSYQMPTMNREHKIMKAR